MHIHLSMHRRLFLASLFFVPTVLLAADADRPKPAEAWVAAVANLADIYAPDAGAEPRTFSATLRVLRAPVSEAVGHSATLAYQAPAHFTLAAEADGKRYALGRSGDEAWFYSSAQKWGVVGKPGLAKFASDPKSIDPAGLPPFAFPDKAKLGLLRLQCTFVERPEETVLGQACRVIVATPTPPAQEAYRIPPIDIELAIPIAPGKAALPARVVVRQDQKFDVAIEIADPKFSAPWPAEKWQVPAQPGDNIETTAVAHFLRFSESLGRSLNASLPTLPAPTGQRQLIAVEGKGRLEMQDGLRVLFLAGSPEEMGRQQGTLLKKPVQDLVEKILYGVGVGSSLAKGKWFFGEIEQAQARLQKHMDPRYIAEMDALADASGLKREEVRLANYFPELFHCSGFALMGSATKDGRIFHGRVLDYLKGIGLEQNACVVVSRPDYGHAWVNIGYAGFIGSVTAMNDQHISIGEMGGRGEGHWDGKPMAQILREVMEKASTLDEAIDLMRKSPRTCEYYYVVADGKSKRAVGIKATPEIFELVEPGAAHPQLPEVVKDAVLMSADERYLELVRRTKAGFGKFDADSARDLMKKPVCMSSNIHSVLFAPDTLDFWVANADGQNVASHTQYRAFNLADLLKAAPAPGKATAAK